MFQSSWKYFCVNRIHSIALDPQCPVVLVIILSFFFFFKSSLEQLQGINHGYGQGGYLKSQMYGAVH